MELELENMLVKTIHVKRTVDTTPGQTPILGPAIAVQVYTEVFEDTKDHAGGAFQQDPRHWFVTKDWPSTLPGGPKYDDVVWLPGLDPNDDTLGKKPRTIETFNDPEIADVDHYEVTL
jgi:hypothetical protein